MNWYYAINQQRNGPISEEEFSRLVLAGTISADTLVWNEGMSEWKRHGDVASPQSGTPEEGSEVCSLSGKVYPKRDMIQYEGKWVSAEHRDEFFQRLREGLGAPSDVVYAGFWIRFGGAFLDGLIGYAIGLTNNWIVTRLMLGEGHFVLNSATQGKPVSSVLGLIAVTSLTSMTIQLIYVATMFAKFQATPGMMAMKIKLVRADGSKVKTPRVIGREFARIISALICCIGYIMAAFDEEKRTLHDRICDTRVVKV